MRCFFISGAFCFFIICPSLLYTIDSPRSFLERKLALNSRVTLTNVFRMPIAVAKEYSAVPLEAMVMLYTYRSSTSMVFLFMLFWNTMY